MTAGDNEPNSFPPETRAPVSLILVVAGAFGVQVLTMVSGVVTARMLGVEGRGAIALVFALGLIATQLSFGGSLPVALAKGLAERRVAARDGVRRLVRRRVALVLIPCFASGGALLFIQRGVLDGESYAIAVILVVTTLFSIAFRVLIGCLQGEVGHLGRMGLVSMVPQLIFTVTLVTAWAADWGWGVVDVMLAFIVASLIGIVAGFFALAKPTHRVEDQLDPSTVWSDTGKTYISSVRPIDGLGLDRVLVGGVLGIVSLGLYSAAVAVAHLCNIIASIISVIVLPEVAQNPDPAERTALIRRWLLLAAAAMVVVVAGLEVIVAPAIRFAFGDEFAGAIPCARWLIVADGLLGFRRVMISVLQAEGRGGTASWIELAMTPILVIGVIVAGQIGNLETVGIAILITGAILCATLGVLVLRNRPTLEVPA